MMAVHAGDQDVADRENGNRNLRMLPAACVAWAVALLVPWLLDRSMGGSMPESAKRTDWAKTAGESKGSMVVGGMDLKVWVMPIILALSLLIAMALLAIKLVCLVATDDHHYRGQVFRQSLRSRRRKLLPRVCARTGNKNHWSKRGLKKNHWNPPCWNVRGTSHLNMTYRSAHF